MNDLYEFADYIEATYPEDIFPSPTPEQWEAIRALDENLSARIYCRAARKIAEMARKFADDIEAGEL